MRNYFVPASHHLLCILSLQAKPSARVVRPRAATGQSASSHDAGTGCPV